MHAAAGAGQRRSIRRALLGWAPPRCQLPPRRLLRQQAHSQEGSGGALPGGLRAVQVCHRGGAKLLQGRRPTRRLSMQLPAPLAVLHRGAAAAAAAAGAVAAHGGRALEGTHIVRDAQWGAQGSCHAGGRTLWAAQRATRRAVPCGDGPRARTCAASMASRVAGGTRSSQGARRRQGCSHARERSDGPPRLCRLRPPPRHCRQPGCSCSAQPGQSAVAGAVGHGT